VIGAVCAAENPEEETAALRSAVERALAARGGEN